MWSDGGASCVYAGTYLRVYTVAITEGGIFEERWEIWLIHGNIRYTQGSKTRNNAAQNHFISILVSKAIQRLLNSFIYEYEAKRKLALSADMILVPNRLHLMTWTASLWRWSSHFLRIDSWSFHSVMSPFSHAMARKRLVGCQPMADTDDHHGSSSSNWLVSRTGLISAPKAFP